MGKVLKIALVIAAVAAVFIPGVGPAISGAINTIAGTIGIAAAVTATAVTVALVGLGVSAAVSLAQRKAQLDADPGYRSTAGVDPGAVQWIVAGETGVPVKIIYFGTSGTTNQNLSLVFVHACCVTNGYTGLKINNIDTAYPTPSGPYAGILSIETVDGTQTTTPFTTVHGGTWGGNDIGQGLSMSHFRWTYDADKLKTGLPSNIQWKLKGISVYDPRRDTTVGGSGTMRANDQTTWAYTAGGADIGRNPALFELSYRLGWRKNGRVFSGMGELPENIDYASYIASANVCDETVNGKPRYRIDALIAIGQDKHNDNLAAIHASCGGRPIDNGGLVGFWVAHDDTAGSVMTIVDDDWRGDINWQPLPDESIRNTARGKFINPAEGYLATDYPEVAPSDLRALDNGDELSDTLDFPTVQDHDQARRLASIRLRESRQGMLSGPMSMRALALRPTDIVSVTHSRAGWVAKKFRVESVTIGFERQELTFRAVASADYADIANVSLTAASSLPTLGYAPALGALATTNTADFSTQVSGAAKPDNNATRNVNRGAWAGSTAYLVGDFVTYGSPQSTYICGAAHTSSGGTPPPNANFTLFAAAGAAGGAGAAGLNNAVVYLYQRAASAPSVPASATTYTFATGVLTGTLGSWTQAPPAVNGQPMYQIQAVASAAATTDSVASADWSTPVIFVQDGAPAPSAAVMTVALAIAVSSSITLTIENGITANFEASMVVDTTGSGSCAADISGEYRIGSGSWTSFGTSVRDPVTGTDSAPTTLNPTWTGSITNSSGVTQIYDVRGTGTYSGTAARTVRTAESYLRGPV